MDNPLVDFKGIERLYHFIKETKVDYACEKGIPLGAGVEIFTSEALYKSFNQAVSSEDREHVTLYLKRHTNLFKIAYPHPSRCNAVTDKRAENLLHGLAALTKHIAMEQGITLPLKNKNRIREIEGY